jgi:hypothetical protein
MPGIPIVAVDMLSNGVLLSFLYFVITGNQLFLRKAACLNESTNVSGNSAVIRSLRAASLRIN